jgi:hypothetical protein
VIDVRDNFFTAVGYTNLGHLDISIRPLLVLPIEMVEVKRVGVLLADERLGGTVSDDIADDVCVLDRRDGLESEVADGRDARADDRQLALLRKRGSDHLEGYE